MKDGLIEIDAPGMEPELEKILYAIIRKVQQKTFDEGYDNLMGGGFWAHKLEEFSKKMDSDKNEKQITDLDIPPAYRTQANLWKAKYFETHKELVKANKGIGRLRRKLAKMKLKREV